MDSMAIFSIFKRSFCELKNIRCLTTTGVLIAMYIVLEIFCCIDTGIFKINFAFLALAAIGMLYGPTVAMLAAIPCDLLAAACRGYTLMIIFTVVAVVEGLIYGLFLYGFDKRKKAAQIALIGISRTTVVIICNIVMNTLFTYYGTMLMSGLPYSTKYGLGEYFIIRITKNAIELPGDIVLIYMVLIPLGIIYKRMKRQSA